MGRRQLLGYGNFPEQFAEFDVINKNNGVPNKVFNDVQYSNSPYLSIFRLLAYHKICNDHYIYRQWQPYQASLCNVDYLTPNSSSLLNIDDALLAIPGTTKADNMNLLDMRFSNLPLDYFTGVLPTAYRDWETDRKSTRLNSSHSAKSRMPSSA